jgi:hypothetical protein
MRLFKIFLCIAISFISIACEQSAEEDMIMIGNYPQTLAGTKWEWDSQYGLRTLDFKTESHLIFHNDHHDPAEGILHFDDDYTYDSFTGRGTIWGGYPAGDFIITNNNTIMYFFNYKNYGHSAGFTRIGTEED